MFCWKRSFQKEKCTRNSYKKQSRNIPINLRKRIFLKLQTKFSLFLSPLQNVILCQRKKHSSPSRSPFHNPFFFCCKLSNGYLELHKRTKSLFFDRRQNFACILFILHLKVFPFPPSKPERIGLIYKKKGSIESDNFICIADFPFCWRGESCTKEVRDLRIS